MANLVASIGRTTGLSLAILPLALEIWRLYGGFFLPPAQLPSYFVWLDAIDFLKYGFVGLALNELEGLTFVCDPTSTITCSFNSGEEIIEHDEADQHPDATPDGEIIESETIDRLLATRDRTGPIVWWNEFLWRASVGKTMELSEGDTRVSILDIAHRVNPHEVAW